MALPHGAPRLTLDEYYARAREFRAWLAEHDKYLDEMSSNDARRNFGRFVRRWNDARLRDAYYAGTVEAPRTRHRWFAGRERASPPRKTADRKSASPPHKTAERRGEAPRKTAADRQYEREQAHDAAQRAAQAERRVARRETKEWIEEQAPRATGRDALHEKRREKAASNRAMAERHQLDDDVADGMSTDALLGTGSSFQDAYVPVLTQPRGARPCRRAALDAVPGAAGRPCGRKRRAACGAAVERGRDDGHVPLGTSPSPPPVSHRWRSDLPSYVRALHTLPRCIS